jgi:hypothetical protein
LNKGGDEMKKTFWVSVIIGIILSVNMVFAQEDDVPYLSDEDIAAIELVLPDDIPENLKEGADEIAGNQAGTENEIFRLNTPQSIYHLLILDRTYCPLNSDIGDINSKNVLYKYKHGTNGYLVAIYKSSREGPVFPQLPNKSRILVNLTTVRKNTIKEYINSSAFKRFVTSRKILSELQKIIESDL